MIYKVTVEDRYLTKLKKAETVFDMAAICYDILTQELNNPAGFISEYIDEGVVEENVKSNPNIPLLTEFAYDVAELLENYPKSTFQEKKQKIIDKMQRIELVAFGQKKENILSAVFTLLSAIDSVIPMWNLIQWGDRQPLNKGDSLRKYIVYPTGECIHEELIQKIGRERKTVPGIDENLNNLIILDRKRLPKKAELPKLNYLERKSEDEKVIKIAIIAGIDGQHFTTKRTIGSREQIVYKEEMQEQTGELICQKMHRAIENGAEFIVLPEFCTGNEILNMIKAKLGDWKRDESLQSKLIAVFPGSTWTDENDNVQFLLDAGGRNIGQYYKTVPFRKRKRGKENKGYEITEALEHPGCRSTFLYVNGVGYVLPATCRDVIDGVYTDYYVEKFTPTVLLIPAWSASGGSFEKPLKRYAADYFTNSVFCNGCGALKKQSTIIGGATVIGKKKTAASGAYESIKKPTECTQPCNKMCSYVLEIKLSPYNIGMEKRITTIAL